jgi:flagellar assembly protein FliH
MTWLFRIDRNYVHLAATQFVRLDNTSAEEKEGAAHKSPDETAGVLRADAIAKEIISGAETKAKRIIMDARNEIAALLLSARDQAEEDRRRAWQEGFAEGSEEGRRSFDEQLAEKMRLDDSSLRSVLDEMYNEMARTYSELEDEVIVLALEIVRKVISPAEDELGNVFKSLIKNALMKLNLDKKIIIRVGPVEYDRFFPLGNTVFELDNGATVKASVLRDAALDEGGCIIDYDDSTVNAGLDSQLKYISLAFDTVKNNTHYLNYGGTSC